jgi:hypothetical protein
MVDLNIGIGVVPRTEVLSAAFNNEIALVVAECVAHYVV